MILFSVRSESFLKNIRRVVQYKKENRKEAQDKSFSGQLNSLQYEIEKYLLNKFSLSFFLVLSSKKKKALKHRKIILLISRSAGKLNDEKTRPAGFPERARIVLQNS